MNLSKFGTRCKKNSNSAGPLSNSNAESKSILTLTRSLNFDVLVSRSTSKGKTTRFHVFSDLRTLMSISFMWRHSCSPLKSPNTTWRSWSWLKLKTQGAVSTSLSLKTTSSLKVISVWLPRWCIHLKHASKFKIWLLIRRHTSSLASIVSRMCVCQSNLECRLCAVIPKRQIFLQQNRAQNVFSSSVIFRYLSVLTTSMKGRNSNRLFLGWSLIIWMSTFGFSRLTMNLEVVVTLL